MNTAYRITLQEFLKDLEKIEESDIAPTMSNDDMYILTSITYKYPIKEVK